MNSLKLVLEGTNDGSSWRSDILDEVDTEKCLEVFVSFEMDCLINLLTCILCKVFKIRQ